MKLFFTSPFIEEEKEYEEMEGRWVGKMVEKECQAKNEEEVEDEYQLEKEEE